MSEEKKLTKRENQLYGDVTDLHYELFYAVNNLMGAKWDSPTLKEDIAKLVHQGFKLMDEIDLMEKKDKQDKENKES